MPPLSASARTVMATLQAHFAEACLYGRFENMAWEFLPEHLTSRLPEGKFDDVLVAHWKHLLRDSAVIDHPAIRRVAAGLAAHMTKGHRPSTTRSERETWIQSARSYLTRAEGAARGHVEATLRAAPPEVQAAFWQRRAPVAGWFRETGQSRAELPQHRLQMQLLVTAVRERAITGTAVYAALRRWGNVRNTLAPLFAAWTEDWHLLANDPPVVPDHDPWQQFVHGALTARAGTSAPDVTYYDDWRKEIVRQMTFAEENSSRNGVASDLLDTYVRTGGDLNTPLTVEALGAFTWVSDDTSIAPSLAEVQRLIARLPDLPNVPTLAKMSAAHLKAADAVTSFVKHLLRHRAVAAVARRAVWARYPSRATRMLLLADCAMAESGQGGPWWHERAFVEEIFTLLVEFKHDQDTIDDRMLLNEYVGFVSADLWLHLLAVSEAAMATGPDAETDRADLATHLRSMEQFPDWRPSVEGLAPILGHRNRVLREWAQFALATATEGPATPRPVLPDIGFTAARAARRR